MSIIAIVKHDIYSIFRHYLTYTSLFLVLSLTGFIFYLFASAEQQLESSTIFMVSAWFIFILGIVFVTKTLTRDIEQGTIELYLSNVRNRVKYLSAKTLSLIAIAILFLFIFVGFTGAVIYLADISLGSTEEFRNLSYLYGLSFLHYGSLLFLISLLTRSNTLTYSISIIMTIIFPLVVAFIPAIPEIGQDIEEILNTYVPTIYLIDHIYQGDFSLNLSQVLIGVISTIVIFIINYYLVTKKDI